MSDKQTTLCENVIEVNTDSDTCPSCHEEMKLLDFLGQPIDGVYPQFFEWYCSDCDIAIPIEVLGDSN